jgi:hypothetical protein
VSPWVLFVLVAAMAVHVRLGLGHWPKPMVEDYRTLAYKIHDDMIGCVFLFGIYVALPLWLIFLCFRRLRLSLAVHLLQLLVFGCGWLAIYFAGKYDPTTFSEWFLD